MMNTCFAIRAGMTARQALMLGTCLLAAGAASAAVAQTTNASPQAAADDNSGSEIVVTALRRDTTVQKTPISITAVRGETLTNMGLSNSTDLSKVAPGLTFLANPDGGSRVVLRNIAAAGEPIVGLYYGETPIASPLGNNNDAGESTPTIRLFDVDRVEVLRGPQGTLFGSSSMAGTVRILYKNPKMNSWEGEVATQVTSADHGDSGYEVQGVINAPLIKDVLAVRATAFYTQAPGWVDDPTLGKKDINDTKSRGGRVMVRFQPTSNLTLDGMAVIQDSSGNNANWRYNGYRDGTAPAYVQPLQTLQPQHDKLRLYTGSSNWDLGAVAVVGNVSWERRDRGYFFDTALLLGRFYPGDPIGDDVGQHLTAATQELRFSSTGDGALHWTVGGFHSVRSERSFSQLDRVDPASGQVIRPSTVASGNMIYDRRIFSNLKQAAVYGDVSYKLFDALTLNAGVRYYDYKSTVGGQILTGATLIGINPTPFAEAKAKDNGWLYKFNASYQVTPDVLIYALASSGFRPGGANQALGLPPSLVPYKPDSLWNYEAGVKSSWFNHTITANIDVFHIDWKNLQSVASAGIFDIVTNAGTVGIDGVETDLAFHPVSGLTLTASASYIVSKLKEDQVIGGGISVTGAGFKGDYVPRTPKLTAQASAQYDYDLTSSLQGLARVDVAYQSTSWMFFQRTDASQQRMPGFATVGARIGVGNKEAGWHVDAFVSNLFDKVGILRLDLSSLMGGADNIRASSIAPRTIGLSASKSF